MKKVLVIDEDADWLGAMEFFLKRQGYDAVLLNSYREGLVVLPFFKPDLILLDIRPGNLDGPLLCKKIKEGVGYRDIPVIFVSGHKEALTLYKDYGANAFLKKPFQLAMLMTTLQEHL